MKVRSSTLVTAAAAIAAVAVLKSFILFQVTATDASLQPAVQRGDRLLVSRLACGLSPLARLTGRTAARQAQWPRRGSIVAYQDPLASQPRPRWHSSLRLARCLSLPGDTLWLYMAHESADTLRPRPVWRPFIVPRQGRPVAVTPWNKALLANALRMHEGVNVCDGDSASLVVDGQPMRHIVFTQDYVWLSARGDSALVADSRVFGFLPTRLLAGSALCISYSKQPGTPPWHGYRSQRLLRPLRPQTGSTPRAATPPSHRP